MKFAFLKFQQEGKLSTRIYGCLENNLIDKVLQWIFKPIIDISKDNTAFWKHIHGGTIFEW